MDVMSQALGALSLRDAHYRRDELRPTGTALTALGGGLHLLESGHAVLEADGVRVALAPGDLLLLPRALQRSLARASRPARVDTWVLSAEFVFAAPDHPLLAALPAVLHVPGRRLSESAFWDAHVACLAAEIDAPREGSRALISRLTEVLMIQALRVSPPPAQTECPNSGWLRGLHDPQLQPALSAMHGTPGRGFTLQSLAKLAGLSRSAFAAHFATTMGEPPMAYLARWRMFRARSLLRESELPLATIAEEVGYGSAAAFSLAFSREHGVSPGAFRARSHRARTPVPVAYRTAKP